MKVHSDVPIVSVTQSVRTSIGVAGNETYQTFVVMMSQLHACLTLIWSRQNGSKYRY